MQGAIEEKIQERAFKKLFLDAVVIQQGRLVEKMKGASRDELLDMIRFGAEEVVRLSDENLGDFDVDELLRSAEQKTEQDKAKIKAMTEKSFSANFSMDGGVPSSTDTFTFDGKDYKDTKKSDGYFLDFGARERKLKSSLNVDASFREQMMQAQVVPKKSMGPRVPKYLQMPQYFEYQFFNVKRLMEINEKKKRAWQTAIDQVRFVFFVFILFAQFCAFSHSL
jgi:SWI/SNF-related matrix-associated actin-dependent regulator of chromatin subfamily A member 5